MRDQANGVELSSIDWSIQADRNVKGQRTFAKAPKDSHS